MLQTLQMQEVEQFQAEIKSLEAQFIMTEIRKRLKEAMELEAWIRRQNG